MIFYVSSDLKEFLKINFVANTFQDSINSFKKEKEKMFNESRDTRVGGAVVISRGIGHGGFSRSPRDISAERKQRYFVVVLLVSLFFLLFFLTSSPACLMYVGPYPELCAFSLSLLHSMNLKGTIVERGVRQVKKKSKFDDLEF